MTYSSRKDWHLTDPRYPALSWYNLQGMLERAEFDVLLVLDCCHAAGAVTKGSGSTMEVLAGCSRESKAAAPGRGCVIGSPFTHTLIQHLEEGAKQPYGLLITELQTFLSLDKVLEDQSPNHVILMGHYNPIKLMPLISEAELELMQTQISQRSEPKLRAVLAVNFRGEILPDMQEFIQWLNSQCSKEVAGIEVKSVSMKIEASFDSCSTLMLLSIPLPMWAYLQEKSWLLVGWIR